MGLNADNICKRCYRVDLKRCDNEFDLWSAGNLLDPDLPELPTVEEMLIARVHVVPEIRQVRGAQYHYKGHIINFMWNTRRVYDRLPLLPRELDIVLLRP